MLITPSKLKETQRQEIAQHIESFIKKGNKITRLDVTYSTKKQLKRSDFSINGKDTDGIKKKPTHLN